jgi:hypothetical protein
MGAFFADAKLKEARRVTSRIEKVNFIRFIFS